MRKRIAAIKNNEETMEVWTSNTTGCIDIEVTNEETVDDDEITASMTLDKEQIRELIKKLEGLL